MKIDTGYISTTKTVRYSTYGVAPEKAEYFWFALHGSKMLSEQMLYKFSDFDPQKHCVVAPEALHRFYEKDFGGPVVASWMTNRDREQDIADNGNYLTALYNDFVSRLGRDAVKIVLAFSQGGTIAYRWLHRHWVDLDAFIPYACWVPEDIDLKESKTNLKSIRTYMTYGTSDQFITQERVEMIKAILQKNNLNTTLYPFEGTHRIEKQQLNTLFTQHLKK